MKYLKLYENEEECVLVDFANKKTEYFSLRTKIMNLINEYIKLNSRFFFDKYKFESSYMTIEDFDLLTLNNGTEMLMFSVDNNMRNFALVKSDLEDLKNFLNTHELRKKYNL